VLGMTTLAEATDLISARLESLGVRPDGTRFTVAVRGRELACRTHDVGYHEEQLDLEQVAGLATSRTCDCQPTAASLSVWCNDADLSLALLAVEQLAALRRLLPAAVPTPPTQVAELLQQVVNLIGRRSVLDLTLAGLTTSHAGPYQRTIEQYAADVLAEHDRLNRAILRDPSVNTLLRRACGTRGNDEVWVLLHPVPFRFADEPDMRERMLGWVMAMSWSPTSARAAELVRLPLWVYRHLRRHLPDIVRSSAYTELTPEVRSTALTLWQDGMQEDRDDFDGCVRTAVLLAR
jgi:hypothetical protein